MTFDAAHAAVVMAVDDLTDAELAALVIAARLGTSPVGRRGYDKALERGLIEPGEERFSPTVAEGLDAALRLRRQGHDRPDQ